ncbi:MAG: DUF2236 domain-containing protein [Actinomycetota bacterium]|nr:DUF2236 domain-containing protein [Actinomycetota bacterium]
MGLSVLRGFPRPLPPGRPGDPGLFGPGTVAWRVNGEGVLLLGGPRALLMQIAHPSVAAGVADHSGFPAEPYRRLWRTMDAMLRVSFGDSEQSRQAAEQVTGVHRRVTGERARDGVAYRAMDPVLLLWVYATLVDTALVVYRRFFRALSPQDEERYHEEMKRLATAMHVPPEILPAGLGEFRTYVAETVDRLEVTEDARRLAPPILRPPLPIPLRPLGALQELVTLGILPPRLRAAYALSWTPARERALAASAGAVRAMVPLLPEALRRWPHARSAQRRASEAAPGP